MSHKPLTLLCAVILCGCPMTMPIHEDGGSSPTDGKCPSVQPDMTVTPVKCAAAKGLAGDNLLCIDFSSIADQALGATPPAKLTGWDFVTNCGGMNWEIASGKLQLKNFSQFASTCGLTLPSINLNDADKQKYNSVTLSLIQRVDINNPNQTAQGFLGSAVPKRTFWITTGNSEHQQVAITLNRTDPVPILAGGVYQYLLQLTSSGMAGSFYQGWQIESIAVMGNL